MKHKVILVAFVLLLCASALAQYPQPITQTFTESTTVAPPAILNSQSYSTTTNTGVVVSQSGGSIAAGTYRVCVTYYTATSTESPCSTDTATTSTVTFTSSTGTLTVYPPVTSGVGLVGSNVVGWRIWVGAASGASGAESVQTINNTVCSLSSNASACSLQSPATFTSSSGFTSGSAPTTFAAVYPPVANQANQAVFENSQYQYHALYWVTTGTVSACTVNIQTGSTIAGLANVGQTLTCTASGWYQLPSNATANYSAINVATLTLGTATSSVTFYEVIQPFNPLGNIYSALYAAIGASTPTTACGAANGGAVAFIATPTTSTAATWFYCNASNAWAAVTLP